MWICTKLYRFRKFLTRFKDFFSVILFALVLLRQLSPSNGQKATASASAWAWDGAGVAEAEAGDDATRRRHGHGRLTHICLLRWRAVLKNGHRECVARCGGQRTHRNFLLFFSIKCATSLCPNLRQHRQRLLAPWVTDKLIVFNWTRAAAAGTVLSRGLYPFSSVLVVFTDLP